MAYLHCGFFLLGYSYASCSCCQGFLSAFYPADFDLLIQGCTASGTQFSFYLMWWKLLEVVNLLLVFQWGSKSSRGVRTFIPVADPSILVPEEPSSLTPEETVFAGRSSGLSYTSQTALKTLLKEKSFPLSSGSCQHTWKPWVSSRMCRAGLRGTPWHCGVPRYSQPQLLDWGCGTLCVRERPSTVQTCVCFRSVPHRKQNLASICACLLSALLLLSNSFP